MKPPGFGGAITHALDMIKGDVRGWQRLWQPGRAEVTGIRLRDVAHLLWRFQGLRAVLLYRIAYASHQAGIPILPGMVTRLNLTLHGFDVPPSVEIAPGLYVPHPVGTVITARKIGSDVTLVSGVTIGMRNEPEFPEIGDEVFIGAGARVLGGISVGHGANIGANAVVVTNVPPGATAVGVPARIKLPVECSQAKRKPRPRNYV